MAEINALVIAEHDNAVHPTGARSTPSPRQLQLGGEVHVLVAGMRPQARGHGRRGRSPASPRCCTPTAKPSPTAWRRTSPRRCSRSPSGYSHILFAGDRVRQEHRAARRRQARRRRRSPTSPRSIRADTFERPIYAGNAIATVQSLDAIKVITVRTTGFDPAAASGGSARGRDGRGGRPIRASRRSSAARSRRTTGPNSPRPRSSSPAAARWARARSSTRC